MLLEKEKIVVTSIFSFSHEFFYPFKDNNSKPLSNIYLVVCKVTGQLIPKSTRTFFGELVPESTGTFVNSYLSIFISFFSDFLSLFVRFLFMFDIIRLYIPCVPYTTYMHFKTWPIPFMLHKFMSKTKYELFLAHLSTTCSRGAFRVTGCPSCVVNNSLNINSS